MRAWLLVIGLLFLGGLATPAATLQPAPQLAISSPFALRGGTLAFTVTGTPGAQVQIFQTLQPAEIDLGATGLQFYQSGTQVLIVAGRIPMNGIFSRSVSTPATTPVGTVFYAQALTVSGGESRLGNSVAYRVEDTVPTGARRTTAIATTPDGQRAYVAHGRGGVVSVLDARNDTRLAELPITADTGGLPYKPIDIAVDPEGRHAFVANAAAMTLAVIHTATGSVAAQIAVPRGSRGIGFDFRGTRRIYVANETANAVLVFEEAPLGTFVARPSIPLVGHAPGPLLVLPDGKLAVGVRTEAQVEILNPAAARGAATVASVPVDGVPFDLAWNAGSILVPTFMPVAENRVAGYNRVVRLDGTTFQNLGYAFQDVGTDYRSIVAQPAVGTAASFIAFNGNGTGTTLVADGASLALLARVELAPGYVMATPQALAVVRSPVTGQAEKIYVTDLLRETVRPILLAGGPPFALGPEIALAWSGQVRLPLSGTLPTSDDGEWFFRSVALFGGTPSAPNTVTCNTCHLDGASNNLVLHDVQVPAAWGLVDTAPYGWQGSAPVLIDLVNSAMLLHNHTGVPAPAGADQIVLAYLSQNQPPVSMYRPTEGTLSADQQAGKVLFEGVAQCSQCHAAPLFVPPAGRPRTINTGIGTGMAPVNVPSLRGVWATGPYLHDGSATTLLDVLTRNPADAHGRLTAPLTPAQRDLLVKYLLAL